MTTPTMGALSPADSQQLAQAASAAASFLPSPVQLAAQTPALGSIAQTSGFAAAAVCDLQGPRTGRLALLVGSQLLDALNNAEGGPVEVHAALQPALDAAAASLGLTASASRPGNPETAGAALGVGWLIVPLAAQQGLAALLISSSAIVSPTQEPAVTQFQNDPAAPVEPTAPGVVRMPSPAQAGAVPAGVPGAGDPAVATMPSMPTVPGAIPGIPGVGGFPDPQSTSGIPDIQQPNRTFGFDVPGEFAAATPGFAPDPVPGHGIELLHGVLMDVTVELGRTQMTVKQLLSMKPGATIELDRAAGAPADLLVNGRVIAKGEVVVIDEDYGLRITDVVANAQIG